MENKDIKKQISLILFILSFSMVSTFMAQGKNIDDKAINAIKEYLTSQNSRLTNEDIRITFKTKSKSLGEFLRNKTARFKVPDSFKTTKITPQMLIPMTITENGQDRGTIVMSVRIEIFKEIVVAKKDIEKNSVINENDVETARKEVTILPPYYVTNIKDVVSHTAKIKVPQGSIVYSTMVKLPPVVQKGSTVKIQVSGENVFVSAQGIALEDGQAGQTIKIRRADSKDTLDVQVINSGVVEVKL